MSGKIVIITRERLKLQRRETFDHQQQNRATASHTLAHHICGAVVSVGDADQAHRTRRFGRVCRICHRDGWPKGQMRTEPLPGICRVLREGRLKRGVWGEAREARIEVLKLRVQRILKS